MKQTYIARLGAIATAGLVVAGVTGGAWAQSSGLAWSPFRADTASYGGTLAYQRDFVRQWESNPPPGYPTLSRGNISATRAAIKRYRQIVKDGGWPKVPKGELATGSNGKAVKLLRERLRAEGHMRSGSYYPTHFGYALERALKRFQATNGLAPTGRTDRRTVTALNVSARTRLRQLRVNYNRLRRNVKSDRSRYVVVNVPSAQIEAVSGGKVVSRHAGVVGKINRRTPLLSSRIHEINFNPPWHLPPTVVREDLIPKGRKMQRAKQDVLKKYNIEAYSGGRKLDSSRINWRSSRVHGLRYRQPPGKDNPLGFAKINFHNAHSVYLHDTPSDRLFGRNFRAASSGCVRVENVETLVAWLLRDTKGWSLTRVHQMKKSRQTRTVRLARPVAIHMVYITAWATADGVVQFRRDIYRRDGVGRIASAY